MDESLATLMDGSREIFAGCNSLWTSDRLPDRTFLSGDHSHQETPVPIPNTTVKLMRPMIVQNSAKVGCCRVLMGGSQKCEPLFFFDCDLHRRRNFSIGRVCVAGALVFEPKFAGKFGGRSDATGS